MKKMYMTATFTMIPELVDEFTTWMEQDHYKKLLETGHFGYAIGKTVDMTDPLKKVCYRLEIQSPEAWTKYQADHRPKLRAEFGDKWAVPMQKTNLTAMVLVGEEEELHLI